MSPLDLSTGTGLLRTEDHRYYWQGEGPFPGVTTVQGMLDKSGPLMRWAAKTVAEQAVSGAYTIAKARRNGTADAELVDALKKLPERNRDKAAELGSSVHWHAEQIANGLTFDVPADELPFINSYLAWRDAWQPEYIAVEYQGINLTHRYGGTGDLIVLHEGDRWLLDIKSGRYYDETLLQLVGCANFEFTGLPNDPMPYEMPAVDRFGVLDLKPHGWQVVEYRFNHADAFEAFASLAFLYHWKKSLKNVQREVGHGIAQIEEGAA